MTNRNLDFDIDLNGTRYESRYAEIMAPIDVGNINGEFVAHPERYGYISFLYREAEIRYSAAKADLDTLEAELDDEVRGRLQQVKEQNEKFKVTETTIKSQIRADPRYVKQKQLVTDLAALEKRLAGAREVLVERRYALISLAASVREGQPIRMNETPEAKKDRARENGSDARTHMGERPALPQPTTVPSAGTPRQDAGRRRPVG